MARDDDCYRIWSSSTLRKEEIDYNVCIIYTFRESVTTSIQIRDDKYCFDSRKSRKKEVNQDRFHHSDSLNPPTVQAPIDFPNRKLGSGERWCVQSKKGNLVLSKKHESGIGRKTLVLETKKPVGRFRVCLILCAKIRTR